MMNLGGPMVMLDAPHAGSAVPGWARVSGWTVDAAAPMTPHVTVDGERANAVLWAVGRPDVVDHYGLVSGVEYGFEGWVDMGGRLGQVRLGIEAQGRDDVEPIEIELDVRAASTARARIDGPLQGVMTLDSVDLFGWAYGVTERIESIEIVGPGICQRCDYGGVRADIETEGISAPAARCGWRATVDLSGCKPGLVPLALVVTDVTGAVMVRWVEIDRAPVGEPLVVLERVEPHGERSCLVGYVVWPDPVPAHASVVVSKGSTKLAEGPADRARPDIAERFPDRIRQARCGFIIWAPRLGPEGATLTAVADDGRVVQLHVPALLSPGRGAGELPAAPELVRLAGEGAAILDWGVGLESGGVPLTVFQPPDISAATLPQRDHSVDVVVVPRDAEAGRLAEAERVGSRLVIAPGDGGDQYDVLWSAEGSRVWPSVSVVIPVHGQNEVTDACLEALLDTAPDAVDLDVVVVDDASPAPSTRHLLESWAARDARVRVIALDQNVGYLRAINRGAREARGEMLVLLNNDTEPQPGWLETVLETFERRPDAGVVGSRLVYPDGMLQDAGGVVFADGSAWNLGRGETPDLPAFSFVRPVHYCTAACFTTPKALWDELGGFDELFAPAYYEDVDYCFAVRRAGRSVLIQPESTVMHREGESHGTDTGAGLKAHQVSNQTRFAEKWAAELSGLDARPEAPDAVALRRIQMMGRV